MTSDPTEISTSEPHDRGFQFSLRRLFLWFFFLGIALTVFIPLADAVRTLRRTAISMNSQCRLNQMQLAFRNYHDVHGQFPPAFIVDGNGIPMHSWRVLILPFIEQQALYDAYDFSEPWNGPNNSLLANQMPSSFRSDSESESDSFTNLVVITGPGTAFPGSTSTTMADFVDGLENTILLTEITNSNVPWLQPRDIDTQKCENLINDPEMLSISCAHWRRPYVVFADHIVTYAVHEDIPPGDLRALTTIAGQESVTRASLINQGLLK